MCGEGRVIIGQCVVIFKDVQSMTIKSAESRIISNGVLTKDTVWELVIHILLVAVGVSNQIHIKGQ